MGIGQQELKLIYGFCFDSTSTYCGDVLHLEKKSLQGDRRYLLIVASDPTSKTSELSTHETLLHKLSRAQRQKAKGTVTQRTPMILLTATLLADLQQSDLKR